MEPYAPLAALVLFTLASLGLGVVAKVAASRKFGFMRKYFLGNRSLGAFSVALTAAVMSGGSFLGFPSFVYSFGWVVGLWIASYMVAGLTVLGLLGKRVGQLSRRTGAITLPDLFRERYGSPGLGLLTSLLVMGFLTVNLVPQFKAGAIVIKSVLPAGWVSATLDPRLANTFAEPSYLIALVGFSATVVLYTTYGGFLAAIWTDVFQSIVMAVGVLILLPMAIHAAGGLTAATTAGVAQTDLGFAFGPGAGRAFHPLTLAISFFVMWAIAGAGQPSTMVRLMAYRDSKTLRYSMIYLAIYNALVYFPLILIFVCARTILPGLAAAGKSDDVMPALVNHLANPYLAGLILAAPYGAVLSTVSGFLLIVASGLVRDLYQRFFRPRATERELARASYGATVFVGIIAAGIALYPPEFLQVLIVFSGTGMAASFLSPAILGCYWRRATAAGAIASMAVGAGVTLLLYALGMFTPAGLGLGWLFPPNAEIGPPLATRPYYLLGFDPCVWGIGLSLLTGVVVSLLTEPPVPRRVAILFDAPSPPSPSAEETPPPWERPR